MRFHCLFEQSGTFKNVFKENGHEACDYDISDEYGQTDCVIDLFEQIEKAYSILTLLPTTNWTGVDIEKFKNQNIFFGMQPNKDFIIAFFPCTYFSELNEINFKKQSIQKVLQRADNRNKFFKTFVKFCFVCEKLGIPTIIENPKGIYNRTYLELYSPYRPSFCDKNRSLFGDKFIKPTNYFAINFDMQENFQMYDREFETIPVMDNSGNLRKGKKAKFKAGDKGRSEITPRYARNFYKRFIEQKLKEETL